MKSEFAINVAIWTAANGDDVLFYEPDREVLAEFLRDRVRPALIDLDANAIAGMPDGRKQRDSVMAIRLAGGGKILGLTPQMKTGKSAYTAPCVVLDEIDKMADPSMITVARSRTTMYGGDGKIVSVSTPTVDIAGAVWRLWSEGSRGRWMGRCAHCGELARVDWSRVKFQRDEDGFWKPKTAEMSCSECGSVWRSRSASAPSAAASSSTTTPIRSTVRFTFPERRTFVSPCGTSWRKGLRRTGAPSKTGRGRRTSFS